MYLDIINTFLCSVKYNHINSEAENSITMTSKRKRIVLMTKTKTYIEKKYEIIKDLKSGNN